MGLNHHLKSSSQQYVCCYSDGKIVRSHSVGLVAVDCLMSVININLFFSSILSHEILQIHVLAYNIQ